MDESRSEVGGKGDDNLVAVGWNRKSRENRGRFVSFLTAKDEDEDEDDVGGLTDLTRLGPKGVSAKLENPGWGH